MASDLVQPSSSPWAPDWLPTNRIDIANGKGGNSAILDVRYVLQVGAGGIQAMLT